MYIQNKVKSGMEKSLGSLFCSGMYILLHGEDSHARTTLTKEFIF